MRRRIVAGNWKMNGSVVSNQALVAQLLAGMGNLSADTDVVVCPPTIYIQSVVDMAQGSPLKVGAQDVSPEASGAFTGDTSAAMAADCGCQYVIVGHSERRTIHGESSELVAAKVEALLAKGLIPVLCVGETLEERQEDKTLDVIREQLGAVLDRVGIEAFASLVIAYEPVWAIGTGMTATPEQAQEIHAFIRALLSERSAEVAAQVQILYGGSVNGSNAGELFSQADIDGGLVGGASLKPDEFLSICSVG